VFRGLRWGLVGGEAAAGGGAGPAGLVAGHGDRRYGRRRRARFRVDPRGVVLLIPSREKKYAPPAGGTVRRTTLFALCCMRAVWPRDNLERRRDTVQTSYRTSKHKCEAH